MDFVSTLPNLLEVFVQSIAQLDLAPGYTVRAVELGGDRGELRIKAQNQKTRLAIRPLLYPSRREIDAFAKGDEQRWLVLSPHIPAALAADYQKAGINHADLNGRLFIRVPGLLVDREPKGQRYSYRLAQPDLFAPRTSRIVRTLLSHRDKSWEQRELLERTQVSPGLVSRVLKILVNEGYVTKQTDTQGTSTATYRLKEFDQLLDAWRAEDDWEKRVTIRQYSVLAGSINEIARTTRDALGEKNIVFTQWFAASLRKPHTTPPLVSAYLDVKKQRGDLQFARPVERGGNLWLITPKDEGVLLETQTVDGFRLTSDVQIYLDLLQAGHRGPEQAEELRHWQGFAR